MAFIFGLDSNAPHVYRHSHAEPIHYPEQDKAITDLRMEEAANIYWQVVGQTDDRGSACNAIRYILTPAQLQSEDFSHILYKRRPARL